ncbi:MAG: hypothetical protein VCB26_08980 [Candidatus Hydrogenedentota bacterium]
MSLLLIPFIVMKVRSQDSVELVPLSAYEIIQTEISFDQSLQMDNGGKHIEHSLKIDGQSNPFFLARSVHDPLDEHGYPVAGFDKNTFKLEILAPDLLLHASWRTVPVGSGAYSVNSNLLLLKKEERGVEIFRDTHEGSSRSGADYYSNTTLDFSYDSTGRGVTIQNKHFRRLFLYEESELLAKRRPSGNNRDVILFEKRYTFVRKWSCKITRDGIEWGDGHYSLDLMGETFGVIAIAKVLQSQRNFHLEKAMSTDDLAQHVKSLNPHLKNPASYSGEILFRKGLAPYEQNRAHMYQGGE